MLEYFQCHRNAEIGDHHDARVFQAGSLEHGRIGAVAVIGRVAGFTGMLDTHRIKIQGYELESRGLQETRHVLADAPIADKQHVVFQLQFAVYRYRAAAGHVRRPIHPVETGARPMRRYSAGTRDLQHAEYDHRQTEFCMRRANHSLRKSQRQ